jgi:hypothetical protein
MTYKNRHEIVEDAFECLEKAYEILKRLNDFDDNDETNDLVLQAKKDMCDAEFHLDKAIRLEKKALGLYNN